MLPGSPTKLSKTISLESILDLNKTSDYNREFSFEKARRIWLFHQLNKSSKDSSKFSKNRAISVCDEVSQTLFENSLLRSDVKRSTPLVKIYLFL
jgi:hypothetical protein